MIVQPYPGATDAAKTHDRIANLCSKYPGRFSGWRVSTRTRTRRPTGREVERCVKELKFVGVKLHPIGHAVIPLSEDGDWSFKTGREWECR